MVQKILSTEQLILRLGDLQEHSVQSLPNTGSQTGVLCERDYYPFQDTSHAERTCILLIHSFLVC